MGVKGGGWQGLDNLQGLISLPEKYHSHLQQDRDSYYQCCCFTLFESNVSHYWHLGQVIFFCEGLSCAL